jgi:signal transduction histidine kinase
LGLFKMFSRPRFQSIHTQMIIWLILPLAAVLTLMIVISVITYRESMHSLVIERHQQLANLAAVSVSQEIEGYANILEAIGSQPGSNSPSPQARMQALSQSGGPLGAFNAGVLQADSNGKVLAAMPGSLLQSWGDVSTYEVFQQSRADLAPAYSDVVADDSGRHLILVSVPVIGEQGEFRGVMLGGLDLASSPLSVPIQKMNSGSSRLAFLVDRRGISISHPDPEQVGLDFSSRPYFGYSLSENYGGKVWVSPEGEQFIGAEALVTPSGWSLIIKEPWDVIISPVRFHSAVFLVIGLLGLLLISVLAWLGTRRLAIPIQQLAGHALLLAEGEVSPTMHQNSILEIDQLRDSIEQMVNQISSYRTGLHHYVGAITQSQEEERLRIARELHDDTIQNLLAISRRLELYAVSEANPLKKEQLTSIHEMLSQTQQGIRLLTQDLRPMVLDDLGFVPAVQMLVRAIHQGQGAVPHPKLEVEGEVVPLTTQQELALYRIIQECLSNVRKHAGATGVLVQLFYRPAEIRLVIRDDGKGFEIPASFTELVQGGCLGLMGIQERVWSVGGTLHMQSKPGQGTEISVVMPRV